MVRALPAAGSARRDRAVPRPHSGGSDRGYPDRPLRRQLRGSLDPAFAWAQSEAGEHRLALRPFGLSGPKRGIGSGHLRAMSHPAPNSCFVGFGLQKHNGERRQSQAHRVGTVVAGSWIRFHATEIALAASPVRSEEHTSELQSHVNLVCRLLLEKKKKAVSIAYDSKITTNVSH